MTEDQGGVRKRLKDLKTFYALSSNDDVVEFLLSHFDDKDIELQTERQMAFEDGRRQAQIECEARICSEVSERLRAVVPCLNHSREMAQLKRERDSAQDELKRVREELEKLKKRSVASDRLIEAMDKRLTGMSQSWKKVRGEINKL